MTTIENFELYKTIASKYYDAKEIDYDELCQDAIRLSAAPYCVINLFAHDKRYTKTIAVAGIKKNIKKAAEVFGFDFVGKEWPVDDFAISSMGSKQLINKGDLSEATPHVSRKQAALIKSLFGIGDLYSIGLYSHEQVVGNLILIMKKGQVPAHPETTELFTRQIGTIIHRCESEKKLQREAEKIKMLAENSPGTFIIANEKLRVIYSNKEPGSSEAGHSLEQVLTFLSPAAIAHCCAVAVQAFANGIIWKEELKSVSDGSENYYELQIIPLKDKPRIREICIILNDVTSRKKTQELVYLQNRFLRETARVGNFEYDIKTKTIHIPEKTEKVFDFFDRQSMTLEEMARYYAPEDYKRVCTAIQKAVATGEGYDLELSVNTGSAKRWIRTITQVKKEKGMPQKIIGIIQDTTEYRNHLIDHQRTANQLAQFQNAVNNASIISKTDRTGRITFVNKNFLKISKYNASELLGKSHNLLCSGHHPADFWKEFWEHISNGLIWKGEIKNKAKDGSYYWVDTTIIPVFNIEGEIIEYLSIRNDITERKEKELQTENMKTRLHTVMNAIDEALWMADFSAGSYYYSEGFYKIFGYRVEEFMQDKDLWRRIVHADDRYKVDEAMEEVLAGRGQVELEYKAIRKDKTEISVHFKIKAEKNDRGEIAKAFGVVSNITGLRAAEQRLNRAQSIAKIGSWEYDSRTREILWSKEHFRIFDTEENSRANIIAICRERIIAEDLPWIEKNLQECWENGKKFSCEYRIADTTGKKKYVQTIGVGIRDESNRIVGIRGTSQDITERKKVKNELYRLQSQLDSIINNVDAIMFSANMEGELVFINDACEKILGYSASQFIRHKRLLMCLLQRSDLKKLPTFYKTLLLTGSLEAELRIVARGGKKVWLSLRAKIINGPNGEPLRIDCFATDISFQKIIAEISTNLVRSNTHSIDQTILDTLGIFGNYIHKDRCCIFQLDPEKKVLVNTHDWEASDSQCLERPPDNINAADYRWLTRQLLKHPVCVIPDLELIPEEGMAEKLAWNKLGVRSVIIVRLSNNNEAFGFLGIASKSVSTPYTNEEMSEILVISNIISDALAKNRLEIRSKEAKEQAEAANKAKTEFLANISHEIRTPMNAVLGFSELLQGKTISPKYENYVSWTLAAGRSLLELINDILDLSKIEAGQMVINRDVVEIDQLIREVHSIFRIKAKEKNLSFHYFIEANTPKRLVLDEIRIRQVLFNIVGNAIKYTNKGSVSIHAFSYFSKDNTDKIKLMFHISDTGIGIPADQQQIIFEPFKQMDGQSTRKYGGTGLGLSITKRLVHMMNGEIRLKSEVNNGTKITLAINDVEIAPEPEYTTNSPVQAVNCVFEGQTVLLVEDLLSNREVIKGILEDNNLNILEAENGKEAMSIMENILPDLILMDIMMPVMDGNEAMQLIKSNPVTMNIPLIAITATSFNHNDLSFQSLCDDYIQKPVSRDRLVSILRNFLSHTDQLPAQKQPDFKEYIDNDEIFVVADSDKDRFRDEWDVVAELMSVDDISEFAGRVLEYAKAENKQALIKYSRELYSYCKAFDIDNMKAHFRKFMVD